MSELIGLAPQSIAGLADVLLLYSGGWQYRRKKRACNHAGNADQPRIGRQLLAHFVLASAISLTLAPVAHAIHWHQRMTGPSLRASVKILIRPSSV
jgi:hypothetical protein